MRKLLLAVVVVVVVVLVPASPAWAHARLVASDPAKDATLAKAPAAVALEFSERLNPDFTTIVVSDAARQRIPVSAPAVVTVKGTVILDQPLSNGTYTVAYRVVSADGHTVQGTYAFTVADPAQPAASAIAAPPATATAAAEAADADGIPIGVLIGLGVLGVVLAGLAAMLYVLLRRRAGQMADQTRQA